MDPDETNAEIGDVVFKLTFVFRGKTQYAPGLLLYTVIDVDDALYYISDYEYCYLLDRPRTIRNLGVIENAYLPRVCQFDRSLEIWYGELG